MFVHRNYVLPLPAIENNFFALFGPYSALNRPFMPIRTESLIFDQTFKLSLDIKLIDSIYT